MSHLMGKPTICICENKDADQLRGNREADHRELISAFIFATRIVQFLFYLNPKFQASSSSVLVQAGLCGTCSETTLLVFPRGGSNLEIGMKMTQLNIVILFNNNVPDK